MKLRERITLVVTVVMCMFAITQSANAAIVSYNIAGHLIVGDSTGDFGHNVNDTFSGTFTYDTTMLILNASPGHVVYNASVPTAPVSYSITIGGTSYSSNPALDIRVSISNDTPAFGGDEFVINSEFGSLIHPLSNSYDISALSIVFRDSTQTAFTSDAIPALLTPLSQFDTALFYLDLIQSGPPPDDKMTQIVGVITSLTGTTIPEPSAGLLLGLMMGIAYKRRISIS